MLLRCLVSFAMVVTILAEDPIAPSIKSASSEILMINSASALQCSLANFSDSMMRNSRMRARTGTYKIPFNYEANTIEPILSNNNILLDGTASNEFLEENLYTNKGYAWCMASFAVYGQVKYLATTKKIRVVTSAPKSITEMLLPEKYSIKKYHDYVIQIKNYECTAATGCSFQIRSEKFVGSELEFVAYEKYVTVDPNSGKLYITKADFDHVKAERFVLIILYKPVGAATVLNFIKLDVEYTKGDRNSSPEELRIDPEEERIIETTVYDGQYGVPLVCIPNQRTPVAWFHRDRVVPTKNSEEFSFDKNGYILYIKKASFATSGTYECKVEHNNIRKFNKFNIIIHEPAKIVSEPQENVIVKVNEHKASLSCKAEGTGEIKMHWRIITFDSKVNPVVNDKPQEKGTEIKYTATIKESTTIICYAENILSAFEDKSKKFFVDSAAYSFYIINKMVVEHNPEDQTHVLEEEASIKTVLRHGNLFNRVCRWFKDGEKVSSKHKVIVDYPSLDLISCILQIEKIQVEDEGKYHAEVSDGVTTLLSETMTLSVLGTPNKVPNKVTESSLANLWWILLVILFIIIVVVIIIVICLYLQRNKGDEYNIDKLERKQGLDPEKELRDEEFKHYQRAEEPHMSSKASLNSTVSMGEDDDNSLLEYGEPDSSKFNEDGSFIEEYGNNRKHSRNDTDV